ncbi:MAG TPA: PaaI family thioesterase [Acidimicrobiales bacterium]|nr:PaaI family thioesterase [Acidimicrobiales bacterium]
MAPLMNADELTAHVHAAFPGGAAEQWMRVEQVTDDSIRVRMRPEPTSLRPGGTVSGPTIFSLVDTVAWVATLAQLGPGRDAVTSSVSIHYLRRPALADLVGEGRLLRMGKRFSVTDVLIYSDGVEEPVAQATVTYAPI